MGDIYKGDAHLLLNAFELDLHILAELQIEGPQGFVQEQHLGPVHQRPRNRHALLLPAGEGVGPPVFKALEADGLQHLQNPLPDFLLGELDRSLRVRRIRPSLHPEAKGHVFKHVQMREKRVLLEYRVNLALIGRDVVNPHTVEENVSRPWGREAANNPQRGGFAAPAGP